MQVTEKTIQEQLRRYYDNHRYVLTNSFVFAWESDFFSVTDSGYIYEIEVKISRGDFKADFIKEKHGLFKAIAAGKKFIVKKDSRNYNQGDVLQKVRVASLDIRHFRRVNTPDVGFTHEEDSFGYWQRRENEVSLRWDWEINRAACTSFKIKDLQKVNLPNRFFYAVPIGMVQPHEVPAYAGLIYVDGFTVTVAKPAPFITKDNIFARLFKTLLDKFYYIAIGQQAQINYLKSKHNGND